MLRIGERVGQKEPAGLLCGLVSGVGNSLSVRLCVWSNLGEGAERLSDAGENLVGARRKRWCAVGRLLEFDIDRISAIVQDARHGVQREYQPLAQRRGKRRVDVAIHHIGQSKNLEAHCRGLAKRLNVFASRAFLDESKLQPLLQFSISLAQAFGEVAPDAFAWGPQHGGGEAQTPGERPLGEEARRRRKQEVDANRHSSRNPDEKP
jgi:hypothetical protein